AERNALGPGWKRNHEGFPDGHSVPNLIIWQLEAELTRLAAPGRVFESAISRNRQLLAFWCIGRRRFCSLASNNAQGVDGERDVERRSPGHRAVRVGHDPLHAKLWIIPADDSAGEAIGISAVAFDPELHPVLLALLNDGLDQVQIFWR